MRAKKLQIALEFMIVFAFVLIVFMLLFALVASQRSQALSGQIFSQEQLIAQSVSAQLDRALQSGNGYTARVPITDTIGTLNFQLYVSKNGAVIVNASVGTQLLHVVAYSTVKNLMSSSSFLVPPSNFFYQLPISNGTIFIQNSFGTICVDYACPTVSTQASNMTLSSELVHAALFASLNSQIQGIANALPYGANAISVFAWIRTSAIARGTVFSYGSTGSRQAASMEVNSLTGDFSADFSSDYADSTIPVNNGVWQFIGFSLPAKSTSITLYVNGNIISTTLSGSYPTITPVSNYHIALWPNNAYGFNGLIANVQVYNGSLSNAQVEALYAQGIATQPAFGANIVGWWPLNGDLKDHSGSGFNGNAAGPVLFPSVAELFADVNNQQGYPLANALVGFASTMGNFSTSQAITNITNANGIATAFVTQQQQNGQALVQATAFDGNSALQGNLVGWWPLSMNQGSTAYDISGYGDNGLLVNSAGWSSPTYVAGFSNKNSFIRIPQSLSLQPVAQTWSFWFMPSALAGSERIFGIGNTLAASSPNGIEAYITANHALGFNTMTQSCSTITPIANNTWYQAAVSWSGATANLKCYLNGMLQNSISAGFLGSITVNSPVYLGTDSFTPATYFFPGRIAGFQAYNSALQANQILQLYNQGIASPPLTSANTIGWWQLNGDANDYSGSGNNGSIYGNVNFASSQINESLSNNATSIAVASFNAINPSITTPLSQGTVNSFTLAFWVNPANAIRMSSANGYTVFNSIGTNAIAVWLNNGGTLGSIPGQGDVSLGIQGIGGTSVYRGYGISNSSWNFLAISVSNGQANFYANGAPVYTSTIAGGPYSISALSIGGMANGVSAFNGLISNVQIYGRTLTSSQVSQIYQQGVAGAPLNNSAANFQLLAWYPLLGNANDYSGNGNNATASNVVYVSQEAVRQALPAPLAASGINFNGASSYVNLGTSAALTPANAVSVNLWMRMNGTSQNPASLLDDGMASCISCSGYGLYINNNGIPTFAIYSGAAVHTATATQGVPYNWHMVTGVYNGIAVSIYVDGIGVSSVANTGLITYTSSCNSAPCNVMLGDSSIHNAKFAGSISNVQVYNIGLTPAQVQNLYQSQTAPSASMQVPLGWYP